jgi:hypothetical protein
MVDNNVYKMLEQGGVMLWACNTENIVIKNYINYNGTDFEVKYIYEKAFGKNTSIKNIIIEKNILSFCDIYGNPIKDSYSQLKNKAELIDVDLGEIECVLGERCFFDCNGLINFKISKNIESIEGHTFEGCSKLRSIDLSKIKKIRGKSNFERCGKLSNIEKFNDELEELPAMTFLRCSNLNIEDLNNIKKLGDECFSSCRQLNQDAITNVEEIGERCFWDCKFSEVYLKEAKKICKKALGGMSTLKKVRFGASEIPFLEKDTTLGSNIDEWVYPKEYINQKGYSLFLSNLEVSTVKWYSNFDNSNYKATQGVKLISLDPPKIERPGYEIEGWYKEPECINKVGKIADLGEINGRDIVIKNPELYAKWNKKAENNSNKSDKEKENEKEKEKSKSSDINEPQGGTEKNEPQKGDTKETDKTKDEPEKEKKKAKEPEETVEKEDLDKDNDSNPKETKKNQSKAAEEQKQLEKNVADELKEQNNINKLKNGKEKKKSKRKSKNRHKKIDLPIKNSIKEFTITINDDEKEIHLKKCDSSSIDYKMAEVFLTAFLKDYNEIEGFNISYEDKNNYNMKIVKNGFLGKIVKDNELACIYLKSNDCDERNSLFEIKLKGNIKLYNLYLYNDELRKFILMNKNLEFEDKLIRISQVNKNQYIITNFELNKEDTVSEGWNKVDNNWYYFGKDGSLVVNSIIDGYRVGSNGQLI